MANAISVGMKSVQFYSSSLSSATAVTSNAGYFYMNYYSGTGCTGVETFVESYTSGVCVATPSGSIKQTCTFEGNRSRIFYPNSFSSSNHDNKLNKGFFSYSF